MKRARKELEGEREKRMRENNIYIYILAGCPIEKTRNPSIVRLHCSTHCPRSSIAEG